MLLKLLYNFLFLVGFGVTWPYFTYRLWRRGNIIKHLGERIMFYSHETISKIQSLKNPIWIHAVSVGEMMIARVLVREIRRIDPNQPIVLTTTTQTGRQVGENMVDEKTVLLYTPIDFYFFIRKAFNLIRPKMLVLVDSEIWPNMLWQADARRIPICLANARLSDRSYRRYSMFAFLLKSTLKKISWIGVQHPEDFPRFAKAGFPPHKLFQIGSLKFDVAEMGNYNAKLAESLRRVLGWRENDRVLLAGSTHPGEEKLIIEIYKKLKHEFEDLKLVLAPRHFERAEKVLADCDGVNMTRRSQLAETESKKTEALLLDTTGELRSLYSMGTVVFIGRSLIGKGGQNFIEAARFGRPVVVGPHMQNFANLTETFRKQNGILQIENEQALYTALRELLRDTALRELLGQKASQIFTANLGAGRKTAQLLMQFGKQ